MMMYVYGYVFVVVFYVLVIFYEYVYDVLSVVKGMYLYVIMIEFFEFEVVMKYLFCFFIY